MTGMIAIFISVMGIYIYIYASEYCMLLKNRGVVQDERVREEGKLDVTN